MANGARVSARSEPFAARSASRSNRLAASRSSFRLPSPARLASPPTRRRFRVESSVASRPRSALEPRLTTAAFPLRPGVNLLFGGRQLRFRKPAETATPGAARPLTLFLLGWSGEPCLSALMFPLRPLRDVVSGRTEARLGEAQRRTAPVPPHPLVLLVLGWTGEPRLATSALATGPRVDLFGRRLKRLIRGSLSGSKLIVAPRLVEDAQRPIIEVPAMRDRTSFIRASGVITSALPLKARWRDTLTLRPARERSRPRGSSHHSIPPGRCARSHWPTQDPPRTTRTHDRPGGLIALARNSTRDQTRPAPR